MIPYYTFLSKDAVDPLRVYVQDLEVRLTRKLDDDDPLFIAGAHNQLKDSKKPINRGNLLRVVKLAAKYAGIERWRDVIPHCLRKAFETAIRSQLLDGGRMDTKTQEFLMGHILPGSQDTYYDKSKVELIRQEYAKVNFSQTQFVNEKELLLRMWREQAKMYGIDPMKVKIEKQKELGRDLSLNEEEDTLKVEIKRMTMPQSINNGKPFQSKIIHEDELPLSVEEGWEIVRELSNGKFLIRRANHDI